MVLQILSNLEVDLGFDPILTEDRRVTNPRQLEELWSLV